LRQTIMASTTWRGIYSSGVGTGMEHPTVNQRLQIQPDRHLPHRLTGFCAAAIGAVPPLSRVAPLATATPRATPTAVLGFVVRGGFNFSSFMF
jgi:hypothetical protein